jgi:transposase
VLHVVGEFGLLSETFIADRIAELDRRLVALTRSDPVCRALSEVPGGGPVIATAFAATVPDADRFRSGRHLAAWLGLVPRQHATGASPVSSA